MAGSNLKFIQINVYKGKYLDSLLGFLRREKPDFISMQEVTAGEVNLYDDKKANTFVIIKEQLGLNGVFYADQKFLNFPNAFFGNAVFTKHPVVESKVIPLRKFRAITLDEFENDNICPLISRHILDAVVDFNGARIHTMSWHGAWTAPPADTPENLRQVKIVVDYLKTLDDPFILGGDLNAIPQSKTIGILRGIARNLMDGSGVIQTTHPNIHKIAPRGFLIDYVFVSDGFKLKSLEVPQITVSDHLPVIARLEFKG